MKALTTAFLKWQEKQLQLVALGNEVFMLAKVLVHDIAKELNITRNQVYARYTQGSPDEKS